VKLNSDRLLARLKAPLVAEGDSQVHGMDYQDSLPVAKLTVRFFYFFGCHSSLVTPPVSY